MSKIAAPESPVEPATPPDSRTADLAAIRAALRPADRELSEQVARPVRAMKAAGYSDEDVVAAVLAHFDVYAARRRREERRARRRRTAAAPSRVVVAAPAVPASARERRSRSSSTGTAASRTDPPADEPPPPEIPARHLDGGAT